MKHWAVALLTAAGTGFGLANLASAADLGRPAMPTKAPALIVADDWSGFYVGGHLGAAWSRSGYTLDNSVFVEDFSFDSNSFIGGGHLGVQGQWGSLVLGVEGSFDGTDLSQTNNSVIDPARTRSLKIDDIATVTGRLGYAAMPAWLVYVKGGWAGVRTSVNAFNPALGGISFSSSGWNSGYTVGGGVEYKVTRNWVVGAEFNFYNTKFDSAGIATDGSPTRVFNTNADIYSVLFRASYLFK
jgi:outer membrane immunogenic protein